jgi:hypothetical protein
MKGNRILSLLESRSSLKKMDVSLTCAGLRTVWNNELYILSTQCEAKSRCQRRILAPSFLSTLCRGFITIILKILEASLSFQRWNSCSLWFTSRFTFAASQCINSVRIKDKQWKLWLRLQALHKLILYLPLSTQVLRLFITYSYRTWGCALMTRVTGVRCPISSRGFLFATTSRRAVAHPA